jgi:adenylate cyclase
VAANDPSTRLTEDASKSGSCRAWFAVMLERVAQRVRRIAHVMENRVITRRDLRLGSGLILFTYLAVHLVDHALGLVSIDVAEAGLRVAVAVWHSFPGTALLYTAAGIHFALALIAVYERRTLRIPSLEALRIALGFGMPLLLIGHFATTRVAFELYGLRPDYHRIVQALWASGSEGRQLALLAPGWLHGCLGIHFAFGRRALYRRIRPALLVLALLLPLLSALGFLVMGRDLAALGMNDPSLVARATTIDAGQRVGLANVRDGLLVAYFGVIGLVLVVRALRTLSERQRASLITIRYPDRAVRVPRGWTVLETSRRFGIPHRAECSGRARCSTCRVRVIEGTDRCPPPASDERRTLQRIHASSDVRLACQLRPEGDVAVAPVLPLRRARYSNGHIAHRASV